MSRSEGSRQQAEGSPDLDSGLDALRSSQSFHGPAENPAGHDCNDHFAQIYETSEEKFEAAVPFVRHGLDGGDRIMYVVDESTETEVRTALRDGGIDVDTALDSGALSFQTVQDTYLRNDSFDVEEMIEFYGDTVEAATDEYGSLRIVAEMTWIPDDDTSVEQIMEYEQRINELFDRTDSLAICQYNRNLFDPAVIRNVVQTHPHLIYDGAVCHNFYYTPPEEFFGDDLPARENDRMLRTLRDQAATKAELQQREGFLQDLYAITADSTLSFEAKIRRLLELGTEQFDLDIGYFTRTADDDTFEVVEMVGEYDLLEPGLSASLRDTYCENLLASPEPISVRDAADSGWSDDPAYETYGLDSYFATTVHAGGEEYGTLCFASETAREEPFSDAERTFLDLLGQWIDAELERDRRERFLRESYEITSDPALGFEGKLDALFDLGCEMFGLELGAMATVDPDEDRFEVEYVSDDHEHFEPGLELPLSETYCTAATDCGGVGSVDDPVEAGYDDIYVHNEFDIKAYLGTYIEVEGDVNRTFFFVSGEPQDGEFSDDERTFQQLMGQWVKYELERQQRETFLRESYEITSDPSLGFDEKLERLLDLARDRMNLEMAGLTHLPEWDGQFLNEHTVGYGDDADGEVWTDPSEGCYCRQAITEDEPVGIADVRGTDWEDDSIHREHGLTSYLGTKVTSGSTPYGTLWLGSAEPRDREFSENEKTFLKLMGQWVSYEIERREHSEAQQDLYEITAAADLSFDEKLDALFELGCEQFGMELGGLAKVDPDTDYFEVEVVSDDHDHLVPGAQADLSDTYCRVATDQTSEDSGVAPVAVTDPVGDGFEGEMCYEEFGVRTYLGSHIEFEDAPDRTFWFVSNTEREAEFSEAERTFHNLMAEWVQYELERQQRERELRERTDHLDTLIETTPECIKTVAADGTLLQMNAAGLELVEAPTESAVTGENIYDLIAPEHRERFREFNERICQGERGTLEFDIIGLEGTRRNMETHAAPLERPDGTTAHVALTRDVTEQKEREADLRQTKNRFETVFEDSDDSIFIIDPDTDEFVDANPAAAEMTGYTREELLSRSPSALHPDEMEQFRTFLDEVRETGSAWSEDFHCRHKDGSDIPAEMTASAITLDGRSLVLALVRDIEERKKHERYQRELYEITAATDLTFDEKLEHLLKLGRERFGLEMGALNHLPDWNGEFRLEKGVGLGVDPGEELWSDPSEGCYCRQTITENDPVAMPDVRGTNWTEDIIHEEFGLTSYFGTQVSSDSKPYGTLWFGSTEPRDEPFSAAERSFLELLGQWVSYELDREEHKRYERKLYEITADNELQFEEKMEQLLELGCERLGLGIGMVTNEHGKSFEIEKMQGTHPELDEGMLTPEMTDNYCRRVVSTGESISVPDVGEAGWDEDALFHQFDLQCYAGVEVTVDDDTYGTIFFSDRTPREREFTESEQTFLELMAQQVSYELERKQRESRLAALNDLSRDLIEARDGSAISESVVDVATDQLDLPVTVIAEYDESDGALQPTAYTEDAAPIVEASSLLDVGDGIAWDAFVQREQRRESTPLGDLDVDPHPPISEVVACPIGRRGVVIAGSTATNGMSSMDIELAETVAATARSAFDRAEREQQLEEREQTLETQNEALERLDRVNDIIRNIDQALVQASTHEEIEDVVCERLANAGPYELAWVGGHDQVTSEIIPRESAGAKKGYLDGLSITTEDDESSRPPARAVETRELQVSNNILSDDTSATWRQDALNRGYHALISLPLVYHDKCYGVLNVYAGQPGVFDELEQSVLAELSDTIAYAMNAVESKKALVSNTVTELEFAIEDGDLCMPTIATEAECTFSLEKIVPASNGGLRTFFTTRGTDPDSVLSLESDLSLDAIELVSEREEDGETVCLFTAELGSESFAAVVLEHGGRLSHAQAVGNEATMTVEIAADAAVREFVEMFQARYPALTLVAQRTEDRASQTTEEFHAAITEELTSRQLEAIQTAYFSGFFERPRPRTGSEIADAMDISQPTFNGHLRTAQRKLCRRLFDGEPV